MTSFSLATNGVTFLQSNAGVFIFKAHILHSVGGGRSYNRSRNYLFDLKPLRASDQLPKPVSEKLMILQGPESESNKIAWAHIGISELCGHMTSR
jgi:hypothetical protein